MTVFVFHECVAQIYVSRVISGLSLGGLHLSVKYEGLPLFDELCPMFVIYFVSSQYVVVYLCHNIAFSILFRCTSGAKRVKYGKLLADVLDLCGRKI